MGSCCIAQGAQLGALWWPRRVDEAQEGGDRCVHMTDSLCCTAEINTTFKAIILQKKNNNNHNLCTGEGNGNPLQYSCLENPRDRGACWAAVYGVSQSQTRLKWLSSMEFLISISYCTWHFISMLTLNPRGNSLREMFFSFYRQGHGVSDRLSALSHKLQSLICIRAPLQSRYFYSPINYTSCTVILPRSSLMEVTVVIRSIWLDS